MSSEAEARTAIDDAIARYGHTRQAYGQYWKPYGKGGELLQQFADQLQPNRDALSAALDAYRQQIERRVLAQHFGSSGWPHEYVMRSGLHKENCRACKILNTARTAQTQETSG